MAHQSILKKIQPLLRRNGVHGYRGGAIVLELELDAKTSFPLESKLTMLCLTYSLPNILGIFYNCESIINDN